MRTQKPAARHSLSAVTRRSRPRRTVINHSAPAVPAPSVSPGAEYVVVEPATARRWAQADATAFARIRSARSRLNAMEAIAGHMRASPAYAAALIRVAPALAADGKAVNAEWLALRAAAVKALRRELARV